MQIYNFSKFPISKIEKSGFSKFGILQKLLEIPDCPKQIYYRGNKDLFFKNELKYLSVVGSRRITNYGKDALLKVFENLEESPICIISGLAIGTDGEAHKNALKKKLPAIAFPGSGLGEKVLYPKINKQLAYEILESNGLLISEFEENFSAAKWTFPSRNRLMAALSDSVLLVEASMKSGTMITARLASEYNKDVWCIPGSIFSENSSGTNYLIANGAMLVKDSNSILEGFRLEIKNTFDISKIDLSDDEKKIIENLKTDLSKDLLHEYSGLESSLFLMSLTLLEMKGLIKIDAGVVRKTY